MPPRLEDTITLADGRSLSFAEYGNPDAVPLFLFHGLPGSRLAVEAFWDEEPADLRVIAPDRPGMGRSDYQPGRQLLDWPGDIEQLADSLGIGRFLAAGVSGGANHALACAYALPDRVLATASICGPGPVDAPGVIESMQSMHRGNRTVFTVARKAPFLLYPFMVPVAVLSRYLPSATAVAARGLPAPDRKVLENKRFRQLTEKTAGEAFRQWVRPTIQETRIHALPWGFEPSGIKGKVFLFHGDQDANAPVAMVRQVAGAIPDHELTIYPGEGHLIIPTHWTEISNALLSVAAVDRVSPREQATKKEGLA